jgi:hypothetical protein
MGLDCLKPNSQALAMGSLRRSDTRLDNEMSERTSERCRNGLWLVHCMSEQGRPPVATPPNGRMEDDCTRSSAPAAVLRADWASASAALHRARACAAVQAREARAARPTASLAVLKGARTEAELGLRHGHLWPGDRRRCGGRGQRRRLLDGPGQRRCRIGARAMHREG